MHFFENDYFAFLRPMQMVMVFHHHHRTAMDSACKIDIPMMLLSVLSFPRVVTLTALPSGFPGSTRYCIQYGGVTL